MQEERSSDPSTGDVIQLLLDLASHAKILKHLPGKITIKFRLSGLGVVQDVSFTDLSQSIPGIKKASTSLWRRSVVIEYDVAWIQPDLWEELINADQNPAKQNLLKDRLRAILKKQNN